MRVLFPINEAAPLYKIGGLGDVGGSLPTHLREMGLDVRLALPKHPEINLAHKDFLVLEKIPIVYDRQSLLVTVYQGYLPGSRTPLYLFAEDRYLSKPSNASDNDADKYAVFCLAVGMWLKHTIYDWHPQLIHLNDWHTALIPLIYKHNLHLSYLKSLITIHNLAYQGDTNTPVAQKLSLSPKSCQILSWDEADGTLNILLEGLLHADAITAVSPTYAQEILTGEYGEHLEDVLNHCAGKLTGIVNGLDTVQFDPSTDPAVSHRFDSGNFVEAKRQNKIDLIQSFELPISPDDPLVIFIGRVDGHQKGIDLILESLRGQKLPPNPGQFILLGTGDPGLEHELHTFDSQTRVKIITRFDESLSRKLYAAADFILIPSKYEPCGLIQLIAMRYGTIPIARATGGLKDTIKDNVTGFLFNDYRSTALVDRLNEALSVYLNKPVFNQMIHDAMSLDFSWQVPARQYAQLYQDLV